jgi:hypothetical protein
MTNEELELFKVLQPNIKEAMGEWRPGDWGYDELSCVECFCNSTYPLTFIFPASGTRVLNITKILRLSHDIDRTNPERGLWGMVDWKKYHVKIEADGLMNIFVDYGMNGKEYVTNGWQTPTLALLKVLAHQWGVKA